MACTWLCPPGLLCSAEDSRLLFLRRRDRLMGSLGFSSGSLLSPIICREKTTTGCVRYLLLPQQLHAAFTAHAYASKIIPCYKPVKTRRMDKREQRLRISVKSCRIPGSPRLLLPARRPWPRRPGSTFTSCGCRKKTVRYRAVSWQGTGWEPCNSKFAPDA